MRTLDKLWVVVLPDNKGIVYDTFARSERECWDNLVLLCVREQLGTGVTSRMLRSQGYRAKRVSIVLFEATTLRQAKKLIANAKRR